MYWAGGQSTHRLPYEDIVVEAFHRFPADFQLRGYPQYPDSSDIHKPLYLALSRAGYVVGANKRFGLTPLGLSVAEGIVSASEWGITGTMQRLTRADQSELSRMRATRAHLMISASQFHEVVDSDFYAFFKVSARTKPHEFAGRIEAVETLLESSAELGHDVSDLRRSTDWLLDQFAELIQEITGGGDA
jgi:hypothetical protein